MALYRDFVKKLGMYPQTVVPSGDELHNTLTNGMDVVDSGVTFTGKHYTANKDNLAWSDGVNEELNPIYEYGDKRYARVTPYQYDANSYYNDRVANPENIEQVIAAAGDGAAAPRWFKVEPIKWIILNTKGLVDKEAIYNEELGIMTDLPIFKESVYNTILELYAADVLIGGIQFNPAITGRTIWDQSSIYKYLNGDFYNQAFSDDEQIQIQVSTIYNNNGDGTQYNNSAYGLNSNHFVGTGYNPTNQNIYLLSYYELQNSNSPYVNPTKNPIFSSGTAASESRQVSGTDYARAHYLALGSGFCEYWTRTATSGTVVSRVTNLGGFYGGTATTAYYGTRPALTIFYFFHWWTTSGLLFQFSL